MFKIFEFISEAVSWVRIVIAAFAAGIILGAVVYYTHPNTLTLVTAVGIALTGFIVGVIWAIKAWKGKGTGYLLSRIEATPELDDPQEERNTQGKGETEKK